MACGSRRKAHTARKKIGRWYFALVLGVGGLQFHFRRGSQQFWGPFGEVPSVQRPDRLLRLTCKLKHMRADGRRHRVGIAAHIGDGAGDGATFTDPVPFPDRRQ